MPYYLLTTTTTRPVNMEVYTRFPLSTIEYAYLGTVSSKYFVEYKTQYPRTRIVKFLKRYIKQHEQTTNI